MSQFSGQFTITKKDNLRYNFYSMRKKLLSTSLLVFVIIGAMIGFLRYGQGYGVTSSLVNALITAVVGTALLLAINIVATVLRMNSFYKQKKLSDFSVTFTADDTGIHAVSDRGNADLEWNRIVAVRETRSAFYIFITDSYANVMPKDQSTGEQEFDKLRKLLYKHVPNNRLKIKAA